MRSALHARTPRVDDVIVPHLAVYSPRNAPPGGRLKSRLWAFRRASASADAGDARVGGRLDTGPVTRLQLPAILRGFSFPLTGL